MRNGYLKGLKMFMVICTIGLLSSSIINCDSSSSDGDKTSSITITGESGNQVNMNGTWESNCVNDIDDGESESESASLTVSGSSFTRTGNEWWDELNCPGTSDITTKIVGTITLGDDVTVEKNGSDVTAKELDGVFSSYVATCNSADVADELNDENACGFNNWVEGVPKDILGSNCHPDSDFKDVIYIDDTVDPDAWYGGDDDDLDANGYPTELELDSVQYRM